MHAEAFPARPCNIYVLLVISRIAKSHFSGAGGGGEERERVKGRGPTPRSIFFAKETLEDRDDLHRQMCVSSLTSRRK